MSVFAISSTSRFAHRGPCVAACVAAAAVALFVGACSGGNDDGRENTHACDASANVEPTGLQNCTVKMQGHYYVGFAFPYSGAYSTYIGIIEGPPMLAVEDANAAGGIGGKCIGVVACDAGEDDSKAAEAYQELGGIEPLGLIIGPFEPSQTDAVSAVLPTIEKVTITPQGDLDAAAGAQGWFFLALTSVPDMMRALGRFIFRDVSKIPSHLVRVLHTADRLDYAEYTRDGYHDALAAEATGGTYPDFDMVLYDTTLDQIPQAHEDGVDVLCPQIGMAGFAALLQAIQAAIYKPRAIFTAMSFTTWRSSIYDTSYFPRIRSVSYVAPPSYEAFVASYKDAFGAEPSTGQPQLYDATCTGLLAMALATNPTSGPELKGLLHTAFDGTEPVTDCLQGFEIIADGATAVTYAGPGGLTKYADNGGSMGHSMNLLTFTETAEPQVVDCLDLDTLTSCE